MTDATFKRGDRVEYVGVSMKGKRSKVHRILTGVDCRRFRQRAMRGPLLAQEPTEGTDMIDELFMMVLWTVTTPLWFFFAGLMWIILLSPIWMTVWMIDRRLSKRAWARIRAHCEGRA